MGKDVQNQDVGVSKEKERRYGLIGGELISR